MTARISCSFSSTWNSWKSGPACPPHSHRPCRQSPLTYAQVPTAHRPGCSCMPLPSSPASGHALLLLSFLAPQTGPQSAECVSVEPSWPPTSQACAARFDLMSCSSPPVLPSAFWGSMPSAHELLSLSCYSLPPLVWQTKRRSMKAEHRKGSWEGGEWEQANDMKTKACPL